MTKKSDAPAIRFKGFSDAWEQRKLGEVIRLNGRIGFRGYTEKDIVTKDDGGVLTFSPTNIVDNKLTTNCKNTYITRFKYDESPEIKIHNGDILFVKTGSTLGKSALVTGLSEDATLNPQVVVMRTNNLNVEFLAAMLVTNAIISQVNSAKIGGAIPTLTETRIKDFDVAIPVSEAEKEQIGQFFSQLDHLITLHQRKFEKLTNVKKSMLEKMFPQNGSSYPEIRFKGFTDPWEQRKFSDVVATRRGLTYKPSDIRKNGVRVLRSSNIAEDSFVLSDEDVFVVREAVNIDCVRANDILITAANGSSRLVGKHTIISGIPEESAVHGGFMLLGTTKEPHFVNASMGSSWYRRFIELFVAGGNGAIGNLNKNDLDNQDIAIPSEKEQKKIGSFFRQLDNLITLHQRELEKLQNIKKSMLEKMFV